MRTGECGSLKPAVRGLYAVIDTAYVDPGGVVDAARRITGGGARLIQLRAKGLPAGAMLRCARAIRAVASANGAVFIVNDRVDVAMMSGADGVHLGQSDFPAREARRLLGDRAVIGLSTHNLEEAERAASSGADYISFGPIFPTPTKKDADTPRGAAALGEITRSVRIPVVAIGGITCENIGEVLQAGPHAVAVISAILASGDVTAAVSRFVSKIAAGPVEK